MEFSHVVLTFYFIFSSVFHKFNVVHKKSTCPNEKDFHNYCILTIKYLNKFNSALVESFYFQHNMFIIILSIENSLRLNKRLFYLVRFFLSKSYIIRPTYKMKMFLNNNIKVNIKNILVSFNHIKFYHIKLQKKHPTLSMTKNKFKVYGMNLFNFHCVIRQNQTITITIFIDHTKFHSSTKTNNSFCYVVSVLPNTFNQ